MTNDNHQSAFDYHAKICMEDVEVYRLLNGKFAYVAMCAGWLLLDRNGEMQDVVLADALDLENENLWSIVHPDTSRGTPAEWFANALCDAAKAIPAWERVSRAADAILAERETARETEYERSIERAQFNAEIRAY
jgi:hypothetical protein